MRRSGVGSLNREQRIEKRETGKGGKRSSVAQWVDGNEQVMGDAR